MTWTKCVSWPVLPTKLFDKINTNILYELQITFNKVYVSDKINKYIPYVKTITILKKYIKIIRKIIGIIMVIK